MGERIRNILFNTKTIAFVFISLAFYITTILLGERPFVWDVADYWERGENLFRNGFSLTIDSYRGYIFPFYLGLCGRIWGGYKVLGDY